MDNREDKIKLRAHQLWEQDGSPHGHSVDYWLQAEREIGQAGASQASAAQANEGEGNVTAAREYNEGTQKFVKSGRVRAQAKEAAAALDNSEQRQDMQKAEEIGKSHSHGEDPALHQPARQSRAPRAGK